MQLLSQTRQPCSRTCTAQPRRAAAAAHQPSTGAPCISTRSAVLARPISLKSKSVGTSASLSDRHRIRSKISLGFEAPSRQHITFAAGPSEIRCWLLLLDPPEIHTKKQGEGKEERGGGLPGRRQRRRSSPPVRSRAAAPSPSPSRAVALASRAVGKEAPSGWIGSGGCDIRIESGPEWLGRRPNRACFQTGPPKTNDDSGPRLFSNRAALFRPDPGQFRADPGLAERGLSVSCNYSNNKL